MKRHTDTLYNHVVAVHSVAALLLAVP
eukprot:COSAG02_NODE_50775_length_318_cov_0.940639_1_plen_26_part_01